MTKREVQYIDLPILQRSQYSFANSRVTKI